MIGAVTAGFRSTQAKATCMFETPRALAIFSMAANTAKSASR